MTPEQEALEAKMKGKAEAAGEEYKPKSSKPSKPSKL